MDIRSKRFTDSPASRSQDRAHGHYYGVSSPIARTPTRPAQPLLRRAYTEVANGGFGPGEGILGAHRGYHNALTLTGTLADECLRATAHHAPWPAGLLPLCDLGVAQWACVGTTAHRDEIVLFDRDDLTVTDMTLPTLLSAWAGGQDVFATLYQEIQEILREGINPSTKERQVIRGAVSRPRGTRCGRET